MCMFSICKETRYQNCVVFHHPVYVWNPMIEGYGLSHSLRFLYGCSKVGEGERQGCTLERKCLSACVSFLSAKKHKLSKLCGFCHPVHAWNLMIESYGLSHSLGFYVGVAWWVRGKGQGCTLKRKCLLACVFYSICKETCYQNCVVFHHPVYIP